MCQSSSAFLISCYSNQIVPVALFSVAILRIDSFPHDRCRLEPTSVSKETFSILALVLFIGNLVSALLLIALMSDPNDSKELRALTYTEMMNSGRQDFNADEDQHQNELERRLEALEKRVQYLEKVIQRQVRLGRMND